VASRVVLGFSVSLDPPSTISVALVLTHAVLPKDVWLADREIEVPWPAFGIPDALHLDNGREFHSETLSRAAQEYGIALVVRTNRHGQTRIVQKFLREYRPSLDGRSGCTRLPVASIQIPPAPSERDLYGELLISMRAVVPVQLSVGTLRQRVRVLARQLDVRMLVIDEIHALLAGRYREQRVLLNALRFIANELNLLTDDLTTETLVSISDRRRPRPTP
jgi:hypothetical protein